MNSFRPLHWASSVSLDKENREVRRAIGRQAMRKKLIRKNTLPEIQEEGLLTPLRRGASYSAYAGHTPGIGRLRDLEAGPDNHPLHSNVEMAAALVDQVIVNVK